MGITRRPPRSSWLRSRGGAAGAALLSALPLSVRDALDANQAAIATGGANASLWHDKMPNIAGGPGYFHNWAYSDPGETPPYSSYATSYHILTRDGILGRDTLSNR